MRPEHLRLVRRAAAAREAESALTTEQALATLFVAQCQDRLRFDCDRQRFIRWDGARWRVDHKNETVDELGRFVAHHGDDGTAAGIRRARRWATVGGVLAYVKVNPAITCRTEDFDGNGWLLGVQGGVVDLRTGELLDARPEFMLTKVCSVAIAPRGARPRRWIKALLEVFEGRRAMVRYLQRLAGYAALGIKPEAAIAFFYGAGANGKTTIVETLARVLGDYAATASMSTFEESAGDRHPTELARLAGVRLVSASENTRGRRLNVELLKRMTGGDKIAARFMRADFFEFQPVALPILVGNERPRLPTVDGGFARRLHFVEFRRRFERPDLSLAEKLRAEAPEILRWVVDGALAWQRLGGLQPPAEVVQATRAYLEQEDLVGQFFAERCEACNGQSELLADLVREFADWAASVGAPAISGRALADDLEKRGFARVHTRAGKRVLGLRLLVSGGGRDGVTK